MFTHSAQPAKRHPVQAAEGGPAPAHLVDDKVDEIGEAQPRRGLQPTGGRPPAQVPEERRQEGPALLLVLRGRRRYLAEVGGDQPAQRVAHEHHAEEGRLGHVGRRISRRVTQHQPVKSVCKSSLAIFNQKRRARVLQF